MSVTYYVALPFVRTEDGSAPGQAQECQSAPEANRKAEIMSRDPANAGALSFMRSGDPSLGSFADATILKKFGDVPDNLDEL
jgi:hypothetical protein